MRVCATSRCRSSAFSITRGIARAARFALLVRAIHGVDEGIRAAGQFAAVKNVSRENMPKRKDIKKCLIVAAAAFASSLASAQTPQLNIKTKHGYPMEGQRKEQMERLAKQYDLKK